METPDLQYQATATHLLEEVFACSNMLNAPPPPPPQTQAQHEQQEKRSRPQPEQALRCPRCDSTNTKFCYYNNYSLSQPRYFCKGCRRYWTKGGTLRNVPVGGGCRKNKRPSSSSSSKKAQDHQSLAAATNAVLQSLPPPPPLTYDLTLAFAGLQTPPTAGQLGLDDRDHFMLESGATANPIPVPQAPGFLEFLRSGFLDGSSAGLYYGLGGQGGTTQEVEGGVGGEQVVLPPFEGLGAGATVAIKQENTYRSVGEDSKLFMGLQWQQVGGEGGNTNHHMMVDPGRDYWNGVGSSWHGLVHSSLI